MVATTIMSFRAELYQVRHGDLQALHGDCGGRFMVNVVKLLRVYGG